MAILRRTRCSAAEAGRKPKSTVFICAVQARIRGVVSVAFRATMRLALYWRNLGLHRRCAGGMKYPTSIKIKSAFADSTESRAHVCMGGVAPKDLLATVTYWLQYSITVDQVIISNCNDHLI